MKVCDIWDIKFLTDKGVTMDEQTVNLVMAKLTDYHINPATFREQFEGWLLDLSKAQTETTFVTEMSRFVDSTVASQLNIPGIVRQYLDRSSSLGRALLNSPRFQNAVLQVKTTNERDVFVSNSK